MKSLKKLDARGFAHHFILVFIVLIFAIGGTYYLVASHADSCTPVSGASDPTSSPASEPASSPDCTPATSPVSSPSDTLSCVITGVPANPAYGFLMKASVVVYNNGSAAVAPTLSDDLVVSNSQGQGSGAVTTFNMASIAANSHATLVLDKYGYYVQYATATAAKSSYTVTITNPSGGTCSASFTYPIQPKPIPSVTINPDNWATHTRSSIVTDSPKGNVMKMNGSATPANDSIIDTTVGSTFLAKLNNFVAADFGQKAQLCINARGIDSSKSDTISVTLGNLVNGQSSYTYTPGFKNTYSTNCHSFTVATYGNNYSPGGTNIRIVNGNNAGSSVPAVYINTVTITLQ